MLTNSEITARLGICKSTVKRWVRHGLVVRHAYSGQAYLYEAPGPNRQPSTAVDGTDLSTGRRQLAGQRNRDARFWLKELQYEVG